MQGEASTRLGFSDYFRVELEVFAANGQTITVVSVPAPAVRELPEREVLRVREMARA